ncbi:MAG: ATP-binding cassette domain-containing protein [Alphaproteobacteria bacterium]|nr:ATP-binding cassette domain-containing protein [Alphaproteobacteria bacterium]
MTLELRSASLSIASRKVLDGISLACAPGEVTAILGPNGAGKSSVLGLLAGERKPDAGDVVLDGRPISAFAGAALARRRAVLTQGGSPAFALKVFEFVRLARAPFGESPETEAGYVGAALARVGASCFADRLVASLSGGERQRVFIARALAQIDGEPEALPRYLLLDEPAAALDLKHQEAIMRLARALADEGVGVVAVLHDPRAARRYADRCLLLRDGRAFAQGPSRLVLTADHLCELFEIDRETAYGALGEARPVRHLHAAE